MAYNVAISCYPQDGCDAQAQVSEKEKSIPFQIYCDNPEGSSVKSSELPHVQQEIPRVPATEVSKE